MIDFKYEKNKKDWLEKLKTGDNVIVEYMGKISVSTIIVSNDRYINVSGIRFLRSNGYECHFCTNVINKNSSIYPASKKNICAIKLYEKMENYIEEIMSIINRINHFTDIEVKNIRNYLKRKLARL